MKIAAKEVANRAQTVEEVLLPVTPITPITPVAPATHTTPGGIEKKQNNLH